LAYRNWGTDGSNPSPSSAESAANFVFGREAWKGPRRRQGTIPTVSTSSGTDGSNPAPSSGESVSLPELLSRVENPGFPRGSSERQHAIADGTPAILNPQPQANGIRLGSAWRIVRHDETVRLLGFRRWPLPRPKN
jgi:hypothetical protein